MRNMKKLKKGTIITIGAALLLTAFTEISTYGEISKDWNEGEYTGITLSGYSYQNEYVEDIPVYCIQKAPATGKTYNMFFVGDGYTRDEQAEFRDDVSEKTKLLFNTSPYGYFKDRFNVYAIEVPSRVSGKGEDTFFGTINRITTSGKTIAFQLRNSLADKLGINKDKDVYLTTLVSNHQWGTGMSTKAFSAVGKASPHVFVHESGHGGAGLTDEYWAAARAQNGSSKPNRFHVTQIAKDGLTLQELNKLTMYRYDQIDVSKVPWADYLGYRGTIVDGFDEVPQTDVYGRSVSTTEFRPSHKFHMMGNAGAPFCSVCEAEIFKNLNLYFEKPYGIFVPELEFSYQLVDKPTYFCNWASNKANYKPGRTYFPIPEEGEIAVGAAPAEFKTFNTLSVIDPVSGINSDLLDASRHDLTLRTVVSAFKPNFVKLKIKILDRSGTEVAAKEKKILITKVYQSGYAASSGASLELTLLQDEWESLTGIADPDIRNYRLIGEITDVSTGRLLQSTDIK